MIKAIAHRGKGKNWVCGVGSMALYDGPSANKADDLAKTVNHHISLGSSAFTDRFAPIGKTKKAWHVLLGTPGRVGEIIRAFGNQANKADDFAKAFNAAVWAPDAVEMPEVPDTRLDQFDNLDKQDRERGYNQTRQPGESGPQWEIPASPESSLSGEPMDLYKPEDGPT